MNTPFKKRESPLTVEKTKVVEEPVVSKHSFETESRIKYTATMEKQLRIRVKIAAAKKGLQFSQFIEAAVAEKLERDGE